MKKAKVLLLHNILWSHYKAAVFTELHKVLDEHECELSVLQLAVTENQRKKLGDVDVSSHRYPYKLLFNASFEDISLPSKLFTFTRELLRYEYDIIIIPGYSDTMYWIALTISNITGKKIIISFDSTEMDRPHTWHKEILKKWFVSACDAAFCYGTKAREYLLKLGMKSGNIHIRHQATNNDEIRSLFAAALSNRDALTTSLSVSKFNFIYIGRLSAEKNIETLLFAFDRVKKSTVLAEGWGLIIVGDGAEKQRLQQITAAACMQNVYFVGGKSWTEVPAFYALSNVLVLPSLSEPWGLVVNEAMICGLPVILSSRCGAAYDILRDGENGFMFDPQDIEDLASKLSYFIEKPHELARMGINSGLIISDYTPRVAAQQMMRGIASLTESMK